MIANTTTWAAPPLLTPDIPRRASMNVLDVWLTRFQRNPQSSGHNSGKNTIFKSSIILLPRFIKQGSLQIKITETLTFVVQSFTDEINIFAITYQY